MSGATSITIRVPLTIRRRPGRKTIVSQEGASPETIRTRSDPALLKALARAFRWQRLLDDGRYASISEMAEAEEIERGYLGKVLQLTLLAPSVVEAIVDGRQGMTLTLPVLMEGIDAVWTATRLANMPGSNSAAPTPLRLQPRDAKQGMSRPDGVERADRGGEGLVPAQGDLVACIGERRAGSSSSCCATGCTATTPASIAPGQRATRGRTT